MEYERAVEYERDEPEVEQHRTKAYTAGVAGASGYAGAELIRLLGAHPSIDVVWMGANSSAGQPVSALAPGLAADSDISGATLSPLAGDLPELDILFLSLPASEGASFVASLPSESSPKLVDLGPDFRHEDADSYARFYEGPHPLPDALPNWVYGIPELARDQIALADRVANPGCYATAALLALVPLFRAGLVGEGPVFVDGKSGLSGAGRTPAPNLHLPEAYEDVSPYALAGHRHLVEMEEGLSRYAGVAPEIVFNPHLVPMSRGLINTCYFNCREGIGRDDVIATLDEAYAGEPFVIVTESPPHTKASRGANTAYVSVSVREGARAGAIFCALDNLVKGAAGQAIQNANLMLGLPETEGLPLCGVWP